MDKNRYRNVYLTHIYLSMTYDNNIDLGGRLCLDRPTETDNWTILDQALRNSLPGYRAGQQN